MKRKVYNLPIVAHSTAWLSGGICTNGQEFLRLVGNKEESCGNQ